MSAATNAAMDLLVFRDLSVALPGKEFGADGWNVLRRSAIQNRLARGASYEEVAAFVGHTPPDFGEVELEAVPRALRRLAIFGERPADRERKASWDDPRFGIWLFGRRPYSFFVDPKSARRGDLWDLFWFLDAERDPYNWSFGEVWEQILAERLTVDAGVDEDAIESAIRERFWDWREERSKRLSRFLRELTDSWVQSQKLRHHECADGTSLPAITPPDAAGVYFVSGGLGFVKIGVSGNVRKRLVMLQTGNAKKLSLIACVIGGDAGLEAQLHKALGDYRAEGEWFRLSGAVLDVVRHVRNLGTVPSWVSK